ncbi:MAG: hypothetical protein HRU09_09195 [Oligoflexales bacterium]|nr:hypothetical protein [Oligoflexales bacterium]
MLSTAASAFLCAIFLNYHVVDHSEILTNLSRFKSPSRISQTNCKINLRDEGFRIVRNIRDITSSNFLVSYKCPNNEKLSLEIIDNKNNVADRIINYSEESMGEVVLNRKFIKPNGSFSIRARFSTESISEEDLGQADIELYID